MGRLPENFEDWRVPWKDDEFDSEKAARLVFNARKGEEKANDKVKERDTQIATLTDDLETAKAAKSGTDEDAQAELKDLRKENRQLKEAEAKSLPADEKTIWQLTAAVELGLTAQQAKRLVGDDAEAVMEDAKAFARDLGIEVEDGDGGEGGQGQGGDGGQQDPPPFQQPTQRYRTGSNGADRVNVVSNPKDAVTKLPPLFA